jgi:hypothetical protein
MEDYPDFLKATGFDDAIIGTTYDMVSGESRLIYSVQKCAEVLIKRDGMDYEEAIEFLEFNTLCAYVDQAQPIFMHETFGE